MRLFVGSARPLSGRCPSGVLRCTGAVRRALFTGDAESGARSAQVGITAPVGVADHPGFQLLNLLGAAILPANGVYHGPDRRPD
jgi:hypothetical protein